MIFLLNYRTILLRFKPIHLDTTILSSRVSISCSYSILDIELQNIPRLKQQPCFTVVLIDDFSPKGKNIVSLNLCGSLMFRSIRCHISVIKAFKSQSIHHKYYPGVSMNPGFLFSSNYLMNTNVILTLFYADLLSTLLSASNRLQYNQKFKLKLIRILILFAHPQVKEGMSMKINESFHLR